MTVCQLVSFPTLKLYNALTILKTLNFAADIYRVSNTKYFYIQKTEGSAPAF